MICQGLWLLHCISSRGGVCDECSYPRESEFRGRVRHRYTCGAWIARGRASDEWVVCRVAPSEFDSRAGVLLRKIECVGEQTPVRLYLCLCLCLRLPVPSFLCPSKHTHRKKHIISKYARRRLPIKMPTDGEWRALQLSFLLHDSMAVLGHKLSCFECRHSQDAMVLARTGERTPDNAPSDENFRQIH